jgi:hypothetical protein
LKFEPTSAGFTQASNVIFVVSVLPQLEVSYTAAAAPTVAPSNRNASSRSPRSERRSGTRVSAFAVKVFDGEMPFSNADVLDKTDAARAGAGAASRLVQKSTKSSARWSIQSIALAATSTPPPSNFLRLPAVMSALTSVSSVSPGAALRLCDVTRFLSPSPRAEASRALAPAPSACFSTSRSILRADEVAATFLRHLTTFRGHAFHSGTVPTQGRELFSAMNTFPTTRPM